MPALRLIRGEGRRCEDSTSAMRLDERSRRLGVAHEELTLELDRRLAERVAAGAASDGVPAPLWAVIAIESERACSAIATGETEELARRLDWIARRHREPPRGTRLAAYAAALRRACHSGDAVSSRLSLTLLVPYHSLIAWEIAAEDAGAPLEDWARDQLGVAGLGRSLWEAAAAEAGQMLAEWVAVHAARGDSQG